MGASQPASALAIVPRILPTSLDPKSILSSLVQRTSTILGATRASVIRLDRENHPDRAFVFTAVDDPSIEGYSLALADYPEIEAALAAARPLVVRDDPEDAIAQRIRERHRKVPFPLSILFPLNDGESFHGVLFLRFADAQAGVREADVEFCELVAFGAAVALRQAREHERALAELREREHHAQALEESHRLRMEMLSSASHDLRAPLHSILGYLDLLSEGVYGEVSDEQSDVFRNLIGNAQTLLEIVSNLIDHARLEDGQPTVDESVTEPADFLEDLRMTVEPLARLRGLSLVFESAGDLPKRARADWGKVRRILLNLLHNALKFTASGQVRFVTSYAGERLRFVVEDTGAGIPPERMKRIFDRFYRVDPKPTEGPGGLGLSIVKRYTDLLGGAIEATSEPGTGSRFEVSLPATRVS